MTISIHQNSFPDASVSGPQVFYFEQSAESSVIASVMQDTLNNSLNPPKPRVCKSNNDYYILKKTPTPIIIVECGFLSNETEAALLVTDAYQEKTGAGHLSWCHNLTSQTVIPEKANLRSSVTRTGLGGSIRYVFSAFQIGYGTKVNGPRQFFLIGICDQQSCFRFIAQKPTFDNYDRCGCFF